MTMTRRRGDLTAAFVLVRVLQFRSSQSSNRLSLSRASSVLRLCYDTHLYSDTPIAHWRPRFCSLSSLSSLSIRRSTRRSMARSMLLGRSSPMRSSSRPKSSSRRHRLTRGFRQQIRRGTALSNTTRPTNVSQRMERTMRPVRGCPRHTAASAPSNGWRSGTRPATPASGGASTDQLLVSCAVYNQTIKQFLKKNQPVVVVAVVVVVAGAGAVVVVEALVVL
mmetsp:Transcript_996/g.3001  ORF Transcript_996/g.3001 Transcript_996/m.3001 type:complete len:222 (+) Transcript_996:1661-2326(+)